MAEKILSASNKALTLSQRKHVRDNQENYEKHIKRIEAATGVDGWSYDFEGDIAAFGNALADESNKEKFAGILMANYLNSVAEMFEKNMKDDMVKKAFVEALPTKNIFFRQLAAPVQGRHQDVKVENGALYIGCVPANFWVNLSDIYNQKVDTLIPANAGAAPTAGGRQISEDNEALSLTQRKEVREGKTHLETHMKKIETATGLTGWDYDFEGDLAAFGAALEAQNRRDMVGKILSAAYMNSIAEMFERNLKDELVKEAVLAALPEKKIRTRQLAAKPKDCTQEVVIENGILYVGFHPSGFFTNLNNDIGNKKMETIVPQGDATLAAGEPVLSENNKTLTLVQRKLIRDNKSHLEKSLKKVETVTGVAGWTYDFEGDLPAFAKAISKDNFDKVGVILEAAYMNSTSEMIEKNCKDAMIKEAFLEAVPSKKIAFSPLTEKPKDSNQKVWVADGKLYIGCAPANFWVNLSDISNFKIEKIL